MVSLVRIVNRIKLRQEKLALAIAAFPLTCLISHMKCLRDAKVGLLFFVFVVFIACKTAPVTGRKQLSFIPASQEMQLGLTEFDKMKTNQPINHDPAVNAMVQRVGKQIAAACGDDLPNAQWEFVVFESKEANAFCLPGGKVGVYTGLLPITKTDAGLAVVLGHEVGHAAAHHGAERMSHELAAQGGGQLLSAFSASNPKVQALVSTAYPALAQVGFLLPYSRKEESEADHIGIVYMARAGYDPQEAVNFWTRFAEYNKQTGGKEGPAFLRTHPVDDVRIKQIQQWLPEAQAAYKGSSLNK
jgi:predicted Zn-dependent protease